MSEIILDDNQFDQPNTRRRSLLPWWVKFFLWVFMVFGVIAPLTLIITAITGTTFRISLYGLETFQPISIIGILLAVIYALKAVVAFGLWTEKDWAPRAAMVDAIIGIVVCTITMLVLPFVDQSGGFEMKFRVELIVLIFYFNKMRNIESQWMESRVGA